MSTFQSLCPDTAKAIYLTEQAANVVARMDRNHKVLLSAYKCHFCGHWHLTKAVTGAKVDRGEKGSAMSLKMNYGRPKKGNAQGGMRPIQHDTIGDHYMAQLKREAARKRK